MDERMKIESGDNVHFNFEDHFNLEKISSEKIQFAKHYVENDIGIDLEEDSWIFFSPISSTVMGYFVAHIAVEFEKFKENN